MPSEDEPLETVALSVPEPEFARLNSLYPPTVKSSTVGDRAIELVQFYFRTQDAACTFRFPGNGCDLETQVNGTTHRIEVKGTADLDIAWTKLKVSGAPSYNALLNGMPLYRVTGVYERNPVLFILRYQHDFEMQPEARWSISRKA